MSDNGGSGSTAGPGCLTLMFLIFLTLKLTGVGVVADWSWWWVTAPLWVGAIFVVIVLAVIFTLHMRKAARDREAYRRLGRR